MAPPDFSDRETVIDDPERPGPLFAQLRLGPHENFVYLVADPETRKAACIDPAFGVDRILSVLDRWDADLAHILHTHGHFDHVEGAPRLAEETGAAVRIHENDADALEDTGITVTRLEGGETLKTGGLPIEVHSTPGHTAGGLTYQVGHLLFTGDFLFCETAGRCDFPTGSKETMWASLQWFKKAFTDDHVICPGHDYGKTPRLRLGDAKKSNPALSHKAYEEFEKEWFLKAY
ncbi:MAG: MBL fold metallo-hydrolase [Euryarchaeota archaeon]|nr:MBL fold metallo-hydrolase [Euryarchaeota archaeon]